MSPVSINTPSKAATSRAAISKRPAALAEPIPCAPGVQLRAGQRPERPKAETQLLWVEQGDILTGPVSRLVGRFVPGDVLVINDAATLPAALRGRRESGEEVELRLATSLDPETFSKRWKAVLLTPAAHGVDTGARPVPPVLERGERLRFGAGLEAKVMAESTLSPRLVDVCFNLGGEPLAEALYRVGEVISYAHLPTPLRLAEVQTPYARRPWAVEMPSTGRPLSQPLLAALRNKGVVVQTLTHGAGLSATGDEDLDAALPLAERYEIPPNTWRAVLEAKERGRRVIAAGTTVVRALESAAIAGRGGFGLATLRLDARHSLRLVNGLVTGIHSPGESHFELLQAFASEGTLRSLHCRAFHERLLVHELGDLLFLEANA